MIRGIATPSFMDLALKKAENTGKSGEVPIGCVIVRGYEVIATAGNRTLTDRDPTAHAEIMYSPNAAPSITYSGQWRRRALSKGWPPTKASWGIVRTFGGDDVPVGDRDICFSCVA